MINVCIGLLNNILPQLLLNTFEQGSYLQVFWKSIKTLAETIREVTLTSQLGIGMRTNFCLYSLMSHSTVLVAYCALEFLLNYVISTGLLSYQFRVLTAVVIPLIKPPL